MESFPCQIKCFPCKYLGLPLSLKKLTRVQVQPLIDKVAGKLQTQKGRLLDKAGRLTLVRSVMSSILIYFVTVFKLKKWALKKIDKIKRSFLWTGSDQANGGHCLVRWQKTTLPKNLGDLRILEIGAFSRALRLRWLWFQWTEPERPWVGSDTPCDEVDKQLFRASTIVTVGNGNRTTFWHCSWENGRAPRDIAPRLYNLAWRKNRTLRQDITDHNWTRGLWRMQSGEELAEFILLWDVVQEVHLTDEDDQIRWRWTASGQYTAKSAYEAQFRGTYSSFYGATIWKAHIESKLKFFAWLLIQSKLLTADKLLLRHWQCNTICPLCDQELETTVHLCLRCSYSKEVWFLVSNWTGGLHSRK